MKTVPRMRTLCVAEISHIYRPIKICLLYRIFYLVLAEIACFLAAFNRIDIVSVFTVGTVIIHIQMFAAGLQQIYFMILKRTLYVKTTVL
jgi:hypothetical protein